MTIHEAEELWRRDAGRKPGPPDPEAIQRIRSDARIFARRIFFRDVREWAASLLLSATFLAIALQPGAPRTTFFAASLFALLPACWLLIDRLRDRSRQPDVAASCRDHAAYALTSVAHQERLLRTVTWWYLAPLAISSLLLTWAVVVEAPELPIAARGLVALLMLAISVGVLFLVWKLNRLTVRNSLEPRRQELQALLKGLEDDLGAAE